MFLSSLAQALRLDWDFCPVKPKPRLRYASPDTALLATRFFRRSGDYGSTVDNQSLERLTLVALLEYTGFI